MSNQDTPNIDGWPIAAAGRGHPGGANWTIQETPVPAPGVVSNDATSTPGGLLVPRGVQFDSLYPSQAHG
jgi:hypothetical protein